MSINSIGEKDGAGYSDQEWAMRTDLAAAFRLAHRHGMDEVVWNHITARVPGHQEHFLINRMGLRYDEICASNLAKVDVDGTVLDGPDDVPIAGFVIHSAVHRAREDVVCVMHTHTEAGLAVSALKSGLEPLTAEALYCYDDLAYHPFEGVSIELEERQRLAANLGNKHAMILRNHGLLTVGASVGEAFMRMYWLDLACRTQLRVLSTGQPFDLIPEDVCRHTAAQFARFTPGEHEWPALLRLVDDTEPAYRQ